MRLIGAPDVLALHGASLPEGAAPVIRLGDREAGPADVVWRASPGDALPGVRTIAPGGKGLWRRQPLPAADALFGLPSPFADPAGGAPAVLVAGGDEDRRAAAVTALAAAGAPARAVAAVTPTDLAAAAIVVVAGPPGAPLQSLAPAVMAAGRLLVAPRAEPAFGFQAGVDHLAHRNDEELARVTVAALRHPAAFAPVAALGRLAAEAHRASAVLARIAADAA